MEVIKHLAPLGVLDYLWKSIELEEEQRVTLIAITVGLKDTLLVIVLNPDALANLPMALSAACLITSLTMTKGITQRIGFSYQQRVKPCAPSSFTKCNSMNVFSLIYNSMTPSKATQPQKRLEMRATMIEDVEDEDEKKMKEKEKAQGPGILEEVDGKSERKEKKLNDEENMRIKPDTKHEEKGRDESDMSAAAKFL